MYRVTCFEAARSCHFTKTGKQIQCKVELWQKAMNIYKLLANGKVNCTKTVLNVVSATFLLVCF